MSSGESAASLPGHPNPCAEVGWEGRLIRSADVLSLWDRYEAEQKYGGRLPAEVTVSLFKDLGRALGLPIRKRMAMFLYREHALSDPATGLNKEEFLNLFVDTLQPTSRLEMSESLESRGAPAADGSKQRLQAAILNNYPAERDAHGRRKAVR